MLFNSPQFLLFFAIVVTGFFLLPFRIRWIFLLAASLYFYMSWRTEYIFLLVACVTVDYITGLRMGVLEHKADRKKWLVLSLFVNLSILFFFKYFVFADQTIVSILNAFRVPYEGSDLKFILPVGISFYTFQSMSYAIEVYRGDLKPERNYARYMLFVSFFPQLVAGPIVRPTTLLPQVRERQEFDYQRIVAGLRLMLWGMFKKVVIADTIAKVVNQVYNDPTSYSGPALALATVFFAFQIYCDFSGYTDIAIGAANVLGFRLMKNFNLPYHAASIADFWRRWHISLSTWFRDYLYIPLGGNRVSRARQLLNLMIVFVVSGLWHGANWTFLIWGALHGTYYVIGLLTAPYRARLRSILGLERTPWLQQAASVLITFLLVCFAWIFFRANSLADAQYVISHMISGWRSLAAGGDLLATLGLSTFAFEIVAGAIGIAVLLLFELVGGLQAPLVQQVPALRWSLYYAMVLTIVLFGFSAQQFIYFQF